MTDDEFREALLALARRARISVVELDKMLRLIAQEETDPLPMAARGAAFCFGPRRSLAGDDFLSINARVPPPNAEVDLVDAMREYASDIKAAKLALAGPPMLLAELREVVSNGLAWCMFWAIRHPDPALRLRFLQEAVDTAFGNGQACELAKRALARASRIN